MYLGSFFVSMQIKYAAAMPKDCQHFTIPFTGEYEGSPGIQIKKPLLGISMRQCTTVPTTSAKASSIGLCPRLNKERHCDDGKDSLEFGLFSPVMWRNLFWWGFAELETSGGWLFIQGKSCTVARLIHCLSMNSFDSTRGLYVWKPFLVALLQQNLHKRQVQTSDAGLPWMGPSGLKDWRPLWQSSTSLWGKVSSYPPLQIAAGASFWRGTHVRHTKHPPFSVPLQAWRISHRLVLIHPDMRRIYSHSALVATLYPGYGDFLVRRIQSCQIRPRRGCFRLMSDT